MQPINYSIIFAILFIFLIFTVLLIVFSERIAKIYNRLNLKSNVKNSGKLTSGQLLINMGSFLTIMTLWLRYGKSSGSHGWATTTYDVSCFLSGISMVISGMVKRLSASSKRRR